MADLSPTENKNLEVFMSAFDLECLIKVRKQCFSEKFRKKNLVWYSYFFWKDLFHGILIFKFLLEVPNHCYTSAWSFTHTFTSNNYACGIVSKMNKPRLLILINTSYTCDILLCRLMIKKSCPIVSKLLKYNWSIVYIIISWVVLQWNSL